MRTPYLALLAILGVLATQSTFAQGPKGGQSGRIRKPSIEDAIKANVYADNWFKLYINGELVAVDSISFIPHNVVSVDILPAYPMTIAAMARDNADPETGMEYANTNIGDAGFILKLGDGTVTSAGWQAKAFSRGPLNHDTQDPKTVHQPIPENWYAVDFDDSAWGNAQEYSEEQVDPKSPFYEHDFDGAKFIWTDDIELDNTVLFRFKVDSPPDGKARTDFRNLNTLVPDQPRRRPGRRGQRRQPRREQ